MTAHTMSGSGVARRLLGWSLRDLRQQARLKVKAAAAALELVESNIPNMLNTSARAGRLDAPPRVGDYGTGSVARIASPGQERAPSGDCDACLPRPRHGGASAYRGADGRTGSRGNVRLRGAGMHQVQRGRPVARSGA